MYTPEFDNYFYYNTEEVKLDAIKAAIKEREATSPYVYSRNGKTVSTTKTMLNTIVTIK